MSGCASSSIKCTLEQRLRVHRKRIHEQRKRCAETKVDQYITTKEESADIMDHVPPTSFMAVLANTWSWSKHRQTFLDTKNPLNKFRCVGKLIFAVVTWNRFFRIRIGEARKNVVSFVQQSEKKDNESLMFNFEDYKRQDSHAVHPEGTRILSLPSQLKTEKDLTLLLSILRDIQSFSEYPTEMQYNLCKHGWYQKVEPKRVIIKEGHRAVNFYFILSGTVVITVLDPVTKTSQTKCLLKTGMEFGEVALIENSYRGATVLSHTATELLCVDAKDFDYLFTRGGSKSITDPACNVFMRNLDFLKDFPVHLTNRNPQAVLYNHFQRGQILVRDSLVSDWIYIVKSGSLTVLKKLIQPSIHLDKMTMTKQKTRSPALSLEEMTKKHNKISQKRKQQDTLSAVSRITRVNNNKRLPPIEQFSCVDAHAVGSRRINISRQARKQSVLKTSHLKTRAFLALTRPSFRSRNRVLVDLKPMKPSALVESKGKLADILDNWTPPTKCITTSDSTSVFIRVQLLEKGQYFGLMPMIFDNQPSLTLVSNGADCIVLSKAFYLKHTDDVILQNLCKWMVPYPNDQEMQKNLNEYDKWSRYKNKVFRNTVDCNIYS